MSFANPHKLYPPNHGDKKYSDAKISLESLQSKLKAVDEKQPPPSKKSKPTKKYDHFTNKPPPPHERPPRTQAQISSSETIRRIAQDYRALKEKIKTDEKPYISWPNYLNKRLSEGPNKVLHEIREDAKRRLEENKRNYPKWYAFLSEARAKGKPKKKPK